MMKYIKNLFNIIKHIDKKLVIGFSEYGCQANILEFLFIGYVTKEWLGEGYNPVDYYEIQPIVKGSTELRNNNIEKEIIWQIQHLFGNLYIFYK